MYYINRNRKEREREICINEEEEVFLKIKLNWIKIKKEAGIRRIYINNKKKKFKTTNSLKYCVRLIH